MKKKFPVIILYFVIGVFFAGIISYSAVREAYRNRKIEADISKLNQEKEKIQSPKSEKEPMLSKASS